MQRSRSIALATIALAASFVLVAWLGTSIHTPMAIPSLLWAPSGIALAFILLYGPLVTIGIAVGGFVAILVRGADGWVSIGISSTSTSRSTECAMSSHLS
jgi:hypothetical protein